MRETPKYSNLCPRCGRDMFGRERFRLPLLRTVVGSLPVGESPQAPRIPYREYCSQQCADSDKADGFGVVPEKYEPKSILSAEEIFEQILEQFRKSFGLG